MPPIDPKQLLGALGPLLTDQGGIKGSQAALQIASLMKSASKLVSKCVYLNILRATESPEAFSKFIEVGGWDTLNTWLDMARNENNSALLGELLEVYLRLPVTVALLKQNTAAKTIRKMHGKTEDDKLKTLSKQLVDVWMKTIREQNNDAEQDSDEKKKKKKHKDSEKDKEKDYEKDKNHKDIRRSKDEKESDRHRHRDRDSKEKDGQENNKDRKDRDRHKDKDRSQRDKSRLDSKDSSSKSSSSSSSSSQNKHKDAVLTSSKDVRSASSNTASPAEKSKSDGIKEDDSRRRLKTVKAIGSRIRSTGLFEDEEEEVEAPKKPVEKPTKRISLDTKIEESMEKKPRLHLNMPPLSTSSLTSSTTTPTEIMHGRIKIIPPKKPPAHEIQESNVFMDALQQSSYASLGIKKKKKPTTSPSVTTPPVLLRIDPTASLGSTATTTTSVTSPPPQNNVTSAPTSEPGPTSPPLLSPNTAMAQRLTSAPSFYRDTLEETPEKKENEKKEEGRDSPPMLDLMAPVNTQPETPQNEQTMDTSKLDDPPLDFDNAETDMEVAAEEAPKSMKPKKRVSWARESQMEQIFYFEMDENERENVNRPKSFSDLKREEMMSDRRAMETAKRFNNDTMVEVLPWKLPKLIDNAIVVVEAGCNSSQKQIQMEREQSVLCALFFNKVPDTPNEPDPEIPSEEENIKNIPLEDENGSCTEYEHTYNFNDPSSLPYDPEFGALPLQGQTPQQGVGGPQNGQAGAGMVGGQPMGPHGNMSRPAGAGGGAVNMGLMMNSLPPAISHILHVLQQQAQETQDPIMQNLQGMLTNVLQTTNPQDSGMLVDRILNALEPFMNQIPGLSNLINSVKGNGGMDFPAGGGGPGVGGRFMGHPPGPGGPMGGGNPRHGLLGSAPPGYNMDGVGNGNMRPPLGMGSGPMSMMNNGGGNYYGGRGGMGGPPHGHWRGGGGRSRPFKRGGHRGSTVCMYFAKTGTCKFGDNCQFLHPNT